LGSVEFGRAFAVKGLALCEYCPTATADSFYDASPQLSEKKILRLFYSREVFMSPQAKVEFIEPDLAPLPRSQKRIAGLER